MPREVFFVSTSACESCTVKKKNSHGRRPLCRSRCSFFYLKYTWFDFLHSHQTKYVWYVIWCSSVVLPLLTSIVPKLTLHMSFFYYEMRNKINLALILTVVQLIGIHSVMALCDWLCSYCAFCLYTSCIEWLVAFVTVFS